MEPVLFYGVPHGCSFGSIVALEWLGRPYRLCRIEMPLETGERTYVRLNPARQTPTLLLEDGRALSESLAILQHLAARDLCRKLGYPQGSAEFDELNFALALLHTECHSAWGALFYLEDADATTTARALTRAARAYGRIDKLLGDRKWLAGEGPSVADAYLAGTARWGQGWATSTCNTTFRACIDTWRSWSRTRRCASPMPSRIACRRRACGEFRGEVTLAEVASRLLA